MNIKDLKEIFGDIPAATIDEERTVLCDICNKDYTDSNESGGLLFYSYAVCPYCATRIEQDAKSHNEEKIYQSSLPRRQIFCRLG